MFTLTADTFTKFTAGLILAVFLIPTAAQGDDFTPQRGEASRYLEYERQLNAILKTRRDEEKTFIAAVVKKVQEGKIPAKLVNTSFDWVRKKRPDTKYPFIYFERVLRLQADRLNLKDEIPAFDFSIYRTSVGNQTTSQRGMAGQVTELRERLKLTPGTRRR